MHLSCLISVHLKFLPRARTHSAWSVSLLASHLIVNHNVRFDIMPSSQMFPYRKLRLLDFRFACWVHTDRGRCHFISKPCFRFHFWDWLNGRRKLCSLFSVCSLPFCAFSIAILIFFFLFHIFCTLFSSPSVRLIDENCFTMNKFKRRKKKQNFCQ